MSKRPRFRKAFDSQLPKKSQILLESARQHFLSYFSSVLGKLSWKMSLLLICEILVLFLDTLTVDEKHFLRNSQFFQQLIQM